MSRVEHRTGSTCHGNRIRRAVPPCWRSSRRPSGRQHPAFEGHRQPIRRHDPSNRDRWGTASDRGRANRIAAGLWQSCECALVACDRRHRDCDLRRFDIILFPRLGAVVTVGLFIAGQMLASLSLDTFGVLGVPREPPEAVTMMGALAVLTGAAAIVLGQKNATNELFASKLGWLLLALLAGAVLPVQGAINGLLRSDIGAPFVVGTISFAV